MKNLKLYGPFLWMGFNCLKATKPLQEDSLLFTTQSPEVSGTQLTPEESKVELILEPTIGFEPELLDWEFSALTTTIIGKTYVQCKCTVFINNKQSLHYKVAIE